MKALEVHFTEGSSNNHAKNFAFRLDATTGAWTCTPAYDLSFSPGPGGEHAMTVNGEGRAPGIRHLLALAEAREVTKGEALATLDEVRATMARWPDFARAAGLASARTKAIGRILGI